MHEVRFSAATILATLAIGCGGSQDGAHLQHPTLDQDYTSRFVGTWAGSGSIVIGDQAQPATGTQRIGAAGFNRLSIVEVCSGVNGVAGLDSPTTFSMDPVTCPPVSQSCGPVTIHYDTGTGALAQDALTITLKGTGSGCGQILSFTATFTGRLPPSTLPTAQSAIHLVSDAGDYIGGGKPYDYAKETAQITVTSSGGHLSLAIAGHESWFADFQMPSAFARFEPGTYGDLHRYPFHDPVRGGLSWSGEGRGCNTLTGSFVIDSATYTGRALTSVRLRFEQHCEGNAAALHGDISWDASLTTARPDPTPSPAVRWQSALHAEVHRAVP